MKYKNVDKCLIKQQKEINTREFILESISLVSLLLNYSKQKHCSKYAIIKTRTKLICSYGSQDEGVDICRGIIIIHVSLFILMLFEIIKEPKRM